MIWPGVSAVKEERLIIDGDLLGEFQHLPPGVQNDVASRLTAILGRPFQPAAVVALLRNRL